MNQLKKSVRNAQSLNPKKNPARRRRVGAILSSIATRKSREQFSKGVLEYNNRVEDRLAGYVQHTSRIATATEMLVAMKEDDMRNGK